MGNLTVQVIGGAVLVGIIMGICIDVIRDNWAYQYVVEVAHAEEQPREVRIEVVYNWNQETIERKLKESAEKYGASYDELWNTMKCESNFDVDIQSHHKLSYGQEESYGLAQFHIPSGNKTADGRRITKEIALNPEEAIDAMAYHFSKGNQKLWTCYRMLYLQG